MRSVLAAALIVVLAGCSATLGHALAGAQQHPTAATTTAAPAVSPSPTPTRAAPKPAKTSRKPTPAKSTRTTAAVKGVGVWLVAPGGTSTIGPGTKGSIVYRVEVEQATHLSAAAVASTVDATLADPRGWINEGWSFRRVSSGPVNMVVRVAIPSTVDKECAKYNLNTGGIVSCRGGDYVNINLTRWTQGISAYAGHADQYDRLVINHEVGHRLGHSHVGCPGTGKPAPVMMQQYFGLDGCTPNVWPYASAGGTYLD